MLQGNLQGDGLEVGLLHNAEAIIEGAVLLYNVRIAKDDVAFPEITRPDMPYQQAIFACF